MVKVIEKDIFEAPIDILVHQANCFHTMGGGIAAVIKEKYPQAYEADLKTPYGDVSKLGTYSVAKLRVGPYLKYIVNLYSQFNFDSKSRQTDYEHFYSGLLRLKTNLVIKHQDSLKIGIPYGVGCGLGGGNWRIIQTMIEEVFADYPSDVLICKKV